MTAIAIPESVQAYFPRHLDPSQLWVHYNAQADSLTVYFTGTPVPSIWDDVNEYAYVGYSRDDNTAVTGLMIEHFSRWLLVAGRSTEALQPA